MGKINKFNIFFLSNMTVLNREPQPLFRHDMVQEQIFGSSVRQLAMLLLERPKSMKYGFTIIIVINVIVFVGRSLTSSSSYVIVQ